MNIFKHEFKTYFKSTVIWGLSIAGILALYIFLFPAFLENIGTFKTIISRLPIYIQIALGVVVNNISHYEWFFSFVFSYAVLFAGIHAMKLGLSLISREVRWKTVDFLFTRPVSRNKIMSAKLSAAVVSVVIIYAFCVLITLILSVLIIKVNYNPTAIFLMLLSMLFVQLAFLFLGVLVSVFINRIKSPALIAIGIVTALFIAKMLDFSIAGNSLWFLIPFSFFDSNKIAQTGSIEVVSVVWSLIVIAVSVAVSYFVYNKKNIPSV